MRKILFCGGGSAGHVIPNIAIIEDLKGSFETAYVGTDGIEKRLCDENRIPFYTCDAVKIVRGKLLCNLAVPFKLAKSVKRAGEILDEIKPDLIFCKGGYACVPPALAAKKRKIPVITHESDVSAGLANKFIAKSCVKVLTTFPTATKGFDNAVCTGSPIRRSLFNADRQAARAAFGLDMRPTILVSGGGSGSAVINENIRKIAFKVCKDFNILHVCGRGNAVKCDIYGYKQAEFLSDMGLAYACADAAVSRCGSNTANELLAMRIPTLFIPLENKRSRGDQVKNAEYFRALGLCRVLRENMLNGQTLCSAIYELMNDDRLKKTVSECAISRGNEKIIREIVSTLR